MLYLFVHTLRRRSHSDNPMPVTPSNILIRPTYWLLFPCGGGRYTCVEVLLGRVVQYCSKYEFTTRTITLRYQLPFCLYRENSHTGCRALESMEARGSKIDVGIHVTQLL